MKMELQKLYECIDSFGKCLVGTLLKRVELLDKEKALTPSLYKSITKELIWEQVRKLKQLIDVYENVGSIKFVTRKPKDSSEKKL